MKQALAFGLIMALMAATVVVGADEDAKKGDKAKGQRGDRGGITAVLKQLDLDDKQETKIKEAHGVLQEAMKAARENKDREGARAAMGKFRETVMSVLNDEQKEKFEKLMAERRGGDKGKGKGKGKGKRPEKGDDN